MNTSSVVASLLSIQTGFLLGQGFPEKPPMQDAMSSEELVLQYRKAQQDDPMKNLEPATGEDPSVTNRPPSLLANSDFITYGALSTLVPKRAIIQIPKNLADRINSANLTRFVSWADFYAANRGWITTIEVSRTQAEGNEPLAENVQTHIAKSGNLVIATYQGGPISLLPLKEPEVTTTSNQTK